MIRNITFFNFDNQSSNKYQKIIFGCDDKNIEITACGLCCSESWIECIGNSSFNECIGKKFIGCVDTFKTIKMPKSNVQSYDINHIYCLKFDEEIEDDCQFKFLLRNSSNGYYDGYIVEESTDVFYEPIAGKKKSLILLVGLPGCGKTTYGHMLTKSISNSVFYDDIDITLQTNLNKIRTDILNNKKVIVANPRFCVKEEYDNFIQKVNLVNRNESIITYCFLPNKAKSIANIKMRETQIGIANKFLYNIDWFSNYYNDDTISQYNCKRIETY